jgi:hypothetical protein
MFKSSTFSYALARTSQTTQFLFITKITHIYVRILSNYLFLPSPFLNVLTIYCHNWAKTYSIIWPGISSNDSRVFPCGPTDRQTWRSSYSLFATVFLFVCFHGRPWQATDIPQPSWLFVPPALDVPNLVTRCPRAYRRVPYSSGGSWYLWAWNEDR